MLRFALLVVVCGLAVGTPALRQKRASSGCLDAFKNVANPCTVNPNNQVYFPHPGDVTKFIQCDRYGRMYVIQCPENLQYSTATSTCRQAAVATIPPATQPPSGITSPATSGNPCTPQELAAGHIYFAVPGDDTHFIECDMMGHGHVLPCGAGLVWSEARLSCVYRVGSGSGGTGTGTGTVTPKPGGSTGSLTNYCTAANIAAKKLFFAHPDPTKFIQCDLWGQLFVVSCPAGLVWNQYSETCASAFVNVGQPAVHIGK